MISKIAEEIPKNGTATIPIITVPKDAPIRSEAKSLDAGLFSSPIICAKTGN